jgi:hypothetical protein
MLVLLQPLPLLPQSLRVQQRLELLNVEQLADQQQALQQDGRSSR